MTVDLADIRTWLPSMTPEHAAHEARFWARLRRGRPPMVVEHVEPGEPVPFNPQVGRADEPGGSERLPDQRAVQDRAQARAWDVYRDVWAGRGH